MNPSALPVRTDSDAAIGEVSFHELMAAHLRRAPWLVLSAALHSALLLLLWALLPPEAHAASTHSVAISLPEPHEVIEPPPLPEPVPEPEPIVDDVVVVEPLPVAETPADTFDQTENDTRATDSALTNTNPAVGIGDGLAGPYGGRRGPRGKRSGAPPHVHESLDAALRWLRDHQDEDGRWDCDDFMKHDDQALAICDGGGSSVHDVGVTGLALLAFLGDGSTLRQGKYRDTVRKGVAWLKGQQEPNGRFGGAASSDFVYDHAIAAYAMCEAYGLSQYQVLREPAQRGLDYLEAHRNPYRVWRYQPRDNDNDTSVTGWCIMAYEAGRYFGLQVNSGALKLAVGWLDEVSDASGHHGYSKRGEGSARKPGDHAARFPADRGAAMTAVGLFSRCFLGQKPAETPVMNAAAELIATKPPQWDAKAGSVDHYYWYYATYALFQMGGSRWTAWQKKIEPVLLKHQHRDRNNMNLHGSWDPVDVWGDDGGRVYSTAILALTLQANFRYTRLIR